MLCNGSTHIVGCQCGECWVSLIIREFGAFRNRVKVWDCKVSINFVVWCKGCRDQARKGWKGQHLLDIFIYLFIE